MEIGYTNYVVTLLVVTGILILYFDVKAYDREKKKKEKKTATVIGSINLCGGVSLLILNWMIDQWFW
ncbi:hypothetical protein HUG15_21840 [Salicibibacter cibarius]|uniref:Uncharacterized protein n=1 Tax=Salicibibacter cibarius TaxID=2743000 RepID=A0A7T7CDH0_9BACI|nr:CLC_0170 family protein [Salicibibacter cibarius]QQK77960.1 hypothetical protein HUG15_21840 [Salicibibacter cibarius]